MSLRIRPATAADASAACDVLRRSITGCCAQDHGGDPARLQPWLRNKTPDRVRDFILAPAHFPVLAEQDGVVAGFALASAAGEVLLCYVTPEARWTGTGKALLAAMEQRARAAGLPLLRLESTRTALPFYTRNGFTPSGPAITMYGLQAQPMHKPLVAPPG